MAVNKLIKSHQFFVRETPKYLGKMTLKRIMYYPIAYIKFMILEIRSWRIKNGG